MGSPTATASGQYSPTGAVRALSSGILRCVSTLFTSSDGRRFTETSTSFAGRAHIAYGDGQWVVTRPDLNRPASFTSPQAQISTSTDLITWTASAVPTPRDNTDPSGPALTAAFGNGMWLIAAAPLSGGPTTPVFTSRGTATWSPVSQVNATVWSLAFGPAGSRQPDNRSFSHWTRATLKRVDASTLRLDVSGSVLQLVRVGEARLGRHLQPLLGPRGRVLTAQLGPERFLRVD